MVWAKKVFISGIYFRGRTNLVPGHFSFTSGIRQNMKAKHPGNEVGGRNCKTAKINCKFVDTGIYGGPDLQPKSFQISAEKIQNSAEKIQNNAEKIQK